MTATTTPPQLTPPTPGLQTLDKRALAGAIGAMAVFSMATTISFPLLSLLMERAEISAFWIGVNTAMAAIATLAVTPLAPRAMAALGLVPFLAVCAVLTMLALIGFKLTEAYGAWLALRFLLGAAIAGMFLATEFWIVATAPDHLRGRVVAAYAVILSIGYALGPTILILTGTEGWAPFLAAAAVAAGALVPLAFAGAAAPQVERHGAGGAWRFFFSDPSLIWAVALFGVIEFGAMALTPVWGVASGYSEDASIAMIVALAAGNILFQPLLGWASDRFPARRLLGLCAATSLAVAVILPFVADLYPAVIALFFVWGGMAAGLYTVSLAAIGGRYRGGALAAANAAIVMAYGLGALVGPPIVGWSMDLMGPDGLAHAIAVTCIAYGALVAIRSRLR